MNSSENMFIEAALPEVKQDLMALVSWVEEGGWWVNPNERTSCQFVPAPVLEELRARVFDALSLSLEGVDPSVAQMKIHLAAAIVSTQDSEGNNPIHYASSALAKDWIAALLLRRIREGGSQPWTYSGDDNPIPADGVGGLLIAWMDDTEGYGYGLSDRDRQWLLTDLNTRVSASINFEG